MLKVLLFATVQPGRVVKRSLRRVNVGRRRRGERSAAEGGGSRCRAAGRLYLGPCCFPTSPAALMSIVLSLASASLQLSAFPPVCSGRPKKEGTVVGCKCCLFYDTSSVPRPPFSPFSPFRQRTCGRHTFCYQMRYKRSALLSSSCVATCLPWSCVAKKCHNRWSFPL